MRHHHGSTVSRRLCSGFTLIELLIVIAIITVLITMIGLVAPVIQQRIAETHCRKNLKTVHQILMSYAEQNDGWLPDFDGTLLRNGYKWPDAPGRGTLGLWEAMSDVDQMKKLGGSAEVFFCPMHPDYGNYDYWAFDSWEHPHPEHNSWSNYEYYETNLGYYTTISHDDVTYHRSLTDGRLVICRVQGGSDNLPIFADIIRLKTSSALGPYGWYHGDSSSSVEDRAYRGGGNTLFFGGYVVWKEWAELDEQGASTYGPGKPDLSGNTYFFYLGHPAEE